jgi:hypothetical protein
MTHYLLFWRISFLGETISNKTLEIVSPKKRVIDFNCDIFPSTGNSYKYSNDYFFKCCF